jgi:tetratricopeptide (TPR) repeat protein
MTVMRTSENHAAMFQEALEAGRSRDYPRAIELLSRIVGSTDAYPQALLYLGRAYHAVGDFSRAVQVLSFYVRGKTDSIPGLFFLGRAYLSLEQYPLAIRYLKRAVDRDPSFAAGYGLLGLAGLKAHRPEKAIWWFAKALELDPQNKRLQVGYLNTALVLAIRLFFRGDLADSARLFTEVLGQRPASILPHLYLASIYKESDKPSMALYHLDAASQIAPQDPFLHLQKAVVLLAQGQKSAAAAEVRAGAQMLNTAATPNGSPEDLLRYITINLFKEKRYRETVYYGTRLLRESYDDPQLHALVAEAYRNLGELLKAKNHYMRAIEKDKTTLELRYGLLAVLWERHEFGELLSQAARIVQRDSSDGPGRYFHSLALSRTGAAPQQVLAELQQQIKVHGPDPTLMTELGSAYAHAGLPELAEGWYLRSIKVARPDPEALLTLADVYEAMDKKEKVGATLKQYLSLVPGDRPQRRRFVRVLLAREAFPEAAEQITLLLPMERGNTHLKATLAVCYRRMGRYAEALVILRDLLTESPTSEDLLKAAVYCLDKMGARSVGMRTLESYMKQHGESLSLLLMLGVLQFQENSLEKSSQTFRKAVSVSPKDWRANRNLGMVYRKMGNDIFAEKFLEKSAEYRRAAEAAAAAATAKSE